jgi:hypothetical protein
VTGRAGRVVYRKYRPAETGIEVSPYRGEYVAEKQWVLWEDYRKLNSKK